MCVGLDQTAHTELFMRSIWLMFNFGRNIERLKEIKILGPPMNLDRHHNLIGSSPSHDSTLYKVSSKYFFFIY